MGFTSTELVDAPPERVWQVLTDWERSPDWMPGIDSMRQEGSGPPGTGTVVVFQARGAERSSEVTAWDPPRRLALRSVQGGVTADYVYSLEPEGSGTRLTLEADCRTRGAWRLIGPLISWLMARADRVQPTRLKAAVESVS